MDIHGKISQLIHLYMWELSCGFHQVPTLAIAIRRAKRRTQRSKTVTVTVAVAVAVKRL
jgi:hypothetical protein